MKLFGVPVHAHIGSRFFLSRARGLKVCNWFSSVIKLNQSSFIDFIVDSLF